MSTSNLVDLEDIAHDISLGIAHRLFGHQVTKLEFDHALQRWEMRVDITRGETLLIRIDRAQYPDAKVPLDMFWEIFIARQLSEVKKPVYRKVSGVVRLWRIWRHKDGHLYPLNYSQTPWKKNPEGFVESHALPALGSNQGFYGFYHLKEVPRQEGNVVRRARTGNKDSGSGFSYVIGSFLAFGRIVKAKKGCRVQYAKPEYLILPDQNEDFALELMTVAEEYGMKPITAEQARTLKGGLLKDQDWKRK